MDKAFEEHEDAAQGRERQQREDAEEREGVREGGREGGRE